MSGEKKLNIKNAMKNLGALIPKDSVLSVHSKNYFTTQK